MPEEPPQRRDFGGFYRETIAPLRRYLSRFLGNATEAQDVAHDAYLRVRPSMEENTARKPEALLYTTARRLALNHIKRRRISPFSPQPEDLESTASREPDVAHQVMARQELLQLEDAIAALPRGCRTVLLLRKVEMLSHQEIANRLNISVSTVEKQHARALRLLRTLLSDRAPGQPSTGEATA